MNAEKTSTPNFIEISLTVPFEIHETVADFIIENFANSGIVLDDKDDPAKVKISFYVGEGNERTVKAELFDYIASTFPEEKYTNEDIKATPVASEDWVEKYRRGIKPIKIENIVIRPPWHEVDPPGEIDIIIEPKLAFGSGHHETTRLCIMEILNHLKADQTFFDLGCGSGILSILAAKIGAGKVTGVDIDPEAVKNARDNTTTNGAADRVEIISGSIEKAGDETYDFLAANILKNIIVELYENMLRAVRPGGIVLLSGLEITDEKEIIALIEKFGCLKYDINRGKEWLAVRVIKR